MRTSSTLLGALIVAAVNLVHAAPAEQNNGETKTVTAWKTTTCTVTSWRTSTSMVTATCPKTTAFVTTTTTATSAYQSFLVNYNFDNVGNGAPTVVDVEQIGEDDGLNFENINVVNVPVTPVTGLNPVSPPNFAAVTFVQPVEDSGNAADPASINIYYKYSVIDHFNAYYWRYGCVIASEETLDSLPASCNITATGYNRKGQLVASQVFPFKANGATTQDAALGVFSSAFVNLAMLNISVSNSETTAALFDDMLFQLYQYSINEVYTATPTTTVTSS